VSTLKSSQLDLAELLMNSLLGRQVDGNYVVRMYSIRGLGNMADIEGNQVRVTILIYYVEVRKECKFHYFCGQLA